MTRPEAKARARTARTAAQTTPRRLRPLARREFRTLRPPRVFMRTRKPCVRLRRVTEGWKVRFMIPGPGWEKPFITAYLGRCCQSRLGKISTGRVKCRACGKALRQD